MSVTLDAVEFLKVPSSAWHVACDKLDALHYNVFCDDGVCGADVIGDYRGFNEIQFLSLYAHIYYFVCTITWLRV